MAEHKKKFSLIFPENLKKDNSLSTTKKLSFDDLGDFIEEREKIKRALEEYSETKLKIDFSNFSNHVFFDSAVSKFDIAKNRILTEYPYNGSLREKNNYALTSSDYEDYIFDEWPRYVGYAELNGTDQFISASDYENKLYLGSSSLYVSAWIKPVVSTQNLILQILSSSTGPTLKSGYDFYLSGTTDPHIKFTLYSGSSETSVSAAYTDFTASFNNVAVVYDNPEDLLSIYVNDSRKASGTVAFGSIEFAPTTVFVGSGTQVDSTLSNYDYYSGSVDEVRVLHTGSELFHTRNFSRPIHAGERITGSDASDDYLKLNYKFNEGVTGTSSIDEVVVDYSKSGLHGTILNYTDTTKVSGTVMLSDPGDVILYSFHSGVVAFTSSAETSASLYDKNNNNLIFNMIPESILSEDNNEERLLQSFTLAMSRYFDTLKLYIDQFDNLRITNYDNTNETPDLFLPYLKKYFGWKVTEHFGDSNPLEFFFGESVLSTGSLETSLFEIRNQFWRRTLNNLPYLLKTKGKKHNLDAFFNVLGINKDNINLKEYGYLPGGSIQDTRIHKEKAVSMLGIGTGSLGSLSSSFVKAPLLVNGTNSTYTVESLLQLPYVSASYSASLSVLTGAIWQFIDPEQVTGSFTFLWNIPSLESAQTKFVLTSSDGQEFSSSLVSASDGDIVNVAAGLNADQTPFIEVRTIDNDEIDFSASYVGSVALSGVFTGSKYDFIMGANSGSIFTHTTQGFFGEIRYWSRALSGSELDDHALHFESVGIVDPLESPHPLKGHWALNENQATNAAGEINGVIVDLSRNGNIATGSQFAGEENPYDKFLLEYNYLSPSVDLKWTENKIRIRDKTELTIDDVATDTNEVSLEFNLADALNRDISKIFSTFDDINNTIGNPVNKYRDEYADLEGYRRIYFDRLGDSINFTTFFNLFKWFDRKLSDSIKQLLPTRTKFIGGEQVIESHFLERPRYKYQYPIFRTPVDIPEVSLSGVYSVSGAKQDYYESSTAKGTYVNTLYEENTKYTSNIQSGVKTDGIFIKPRDSSVATEADKSVHTVATYTDGDEEIDRNKNEDTGFYRTKYSGDQSDEINNPNIGINHKNEFTRKLLSNNERDNFDGNKSGSFIHKKIGDNAFVIHNVKSTLDNEHYFSNAKKNIKLSVRGLSGTNETLFNNLNIENNSAFKVPAGDFLELTGVLYDTNDVKIGTGSFLERVFGFEPANVREKFGANLTLKVSASDGVNFSSDLIQYRDANGDSFTSIVPKGAIIEDLKDAGEDGYQEVRWKFLEFGNPTISLTNQNRHIKLNPLVRDHYFKDIKIEFNEQLINDGVKEYQDIDNQNNEDIFSYINVNVMPNVED